MYGGNPSGSILQNKTGKMRPRPQASPTSPPASIPSWAIAGLAAWMLLLAGAVFRVIEPLLAVNLQRWLSTPAAVLPEFHALAGQLERFAILGGLTLALAGSGRRVLRLAGVAADNPLEEAVLSFGLGYGLWSVVLFLLGLAGLWGRPFLRALLAAALVPALFEAGSRWRARGSRAAATASPPPALDRVCAGALLFAWLYVVRYALVPETFYDALHYHLALPSLYLDAGRIYATPENSFSGVPGLPQMLYGWTLAFDRWGIAASLLHWSIGIWIAAALIGLSRRLGRPRAGLLAAAAFGLTPVVLCESFRVSVGFEWTLMQLCALTAFLAAWSSEGGTRERRAWLVLCGIFLGFALSTKYPAWLLPLALLPGVSLRGREGPAKGEGRDLSPREFAAVLLVAGLILAPWVVKNILFYGNPIYPFFHESLAPGAAFMPDWRQISLAGTDLKSLLTVPGLVHYLAHPFRLLLPPEDISESLGAFFLAFLPLLFFARLSERERLIAWFCATAWIPLSILSGETRYFIPHLAPLILLLCCVLVEIPSARTRAALLAGACALAAGAAAIWVLGDPNFTKFDTFLGRKTFSEYLGHTVVSYPAPGFAGFEFLNEKTPAGSRVLLYDEPRSFYLKRPVIAASSDQAPVLEAWANDAPDAESLERRVRSAGVRYILVNLGEAARRHLEPKTSTRGMANLDAFWMKRTLRVFGVHEPPDRWVGVYKVLDDAEAALPHAVDDLFAVYAGRLKTR
jgi:hypothetical protein